MRDETIHTLVVSSNVGCYACDDAHQGHDLTAGERCAIQLGGQWIEAVSNTARSLSPTWCHVARPAATTSSVQRAPSAGCVSA